MFTAPLAFAAALVLQNGALPVGNSTAPEKMPTIATPSNGGGGGTAAQPATTRFCVLTTPTGTRIEQRQCHTRKEWLAYGFDPLAKD